MAEFNNWCTSQQKDVSGHPLTLLTTDALRTKYGETATAAIVPSHYASDTRYARILRRLGKQAAAKYIEDKLPTDKKIRSGDLGEILGTSYILESTIWNQTVLKLRWKDSRNMALRGDDLLSACIDDQDNLRLLKGESKSRKSLSLSVVKKARVALDSNNGKPTPHSLAFLSDRLAEEGQVDVSDRIDEAMLTKSIGVKDVTHMMFVFTGNNPETYLATDLNEYKKGVYQWSIGLRVADHQDFIRNVFETVLANGNT